MKSALIPMSGGADSTLVACLLRKARDKYAPWFKLIGVTLPRKLQADADIYNDLGLNAAREYCDEVATVELGKVADFIEDELFDGEKLKFESGRTFAEVRAELTPNRTERQMRIDRGNITARLRMIFSYGWASAFGGAQPSTDNLSELLMGFWTLCGDEGTFKLIQKILKGVEQPVIMKVLEIPAIYIVQKPTDGLGVSDGDVAQLYGELFTGAETYFDVDCVLIGHFMGQKFPDVLNPTIQGLNHPVIKQMLRTGFKRQPFVIERETLGLKPIQSGHD
jgi:NH3-dependent NAD+ synthetase